MEHQHPKARHVHAVFESIADRYDFMNDVISFRRHKAWRRFAMRKMAVQPGQSAIDLCCGTCDWTISLAEASGTGRIVGLDFSEKMLAVGREKIRKANLEDRIELVQGDAMHLPFEDNTFDYATIGFGLRNVPDLVRVLQEMKRVVRPGGMVVCMDASKPVWQPFRAIYFFYFRYLMPLFGKWLAGKYDQYRWLPESLAEFPDYRELLAIFNEIGLEQTKAYPLTGGVAALHIGVKGNENRDQ